jgi:hypothetical protein
MQKINKNMSSSNVKKIDPAKEEKHIHAEFSSRFQEIHQPNSRDGGGGGDGLDGFPNPYLAAPNLQFEDPLQQVVLLNITHRQQNPKSTMPGFRICGAFENVDKLKRHVQTAGGPAAYGGVNLIKADVHKKFLICSSLQKQQEPGYVLDKIDKLSAAYDKTLRFHTEEFNENKAKRQQGKTGLSTKSQQQQSQKLTSRKSLLDKKFEEERKNGSETGDVSRAAEVRGQTVAVVTIFEDTSPEVLSGQKDPEPIVIIWGCFENEEVAKRFIYTTLSKFVKDVSLDIVNMYEWVYPTQIADHVDEISEQYRNPSLNKIMNSRKIQKKAVLSYDEWCKTEGQQPSVLEICATKATADSTEVHTEVKKTEDFDISVSVNGKHSTAAAAAGSDIASSSSWQAVSQKKSTDLFQEVTFKQVPDSKSQVLTTAAASATDCGDDHTAKPAKPADQINTPVPSGSMTTTSNPTFSQPPASNPNQTTQNKRGRPKKM